MSWVPSSELSPDSASGDHWSFKVEVIPQPWPRRGTWELQVVPAAQHHAGHQEGTAAFPSQGASPEPHPRRVLGTLGPGSLPPPSLKLETVALERHFSGLLSDGQNQVSSYPSRG